MLLLRNIPIWIVLIIAAILPLGCTLPPIVAEFTASPDSGASPLEVRLTWDVYNADRHNCLLVLQHEGETVNSAIDDCTAQWTETFEDPGTYEAILVVFEQGFEDELAGDGWMLIRPREHVSFTVTDPVAEATATASATPRVTPSTAGGVWRLVEIDTNPYDLSVEADLHTDNASYAGSFKECTVSDGIITYWHVAKTLVDDLANVLYTYTFDSLPDSVNPGEVVTLTHSLRVDGEVKIGGGYTPTGRAAYSSDIADPPTLSVASASLNDDRYPQEVAEDVILKFPPDGNTFQVQARVLDLQEPDIACDIAWMYQLDE